MHEVKSIEDLLDQIRRGEILLPEFQRGYVWTRDQVRGLMQSLYRRHPTGHLLIWRTYKPSPVRGGEAMRDGHSLLLLDGQQRLTTLYVLFKGQAPKFYEGESLFFDLYFNVQTEEFRFWQKTRMENNPTWFSVHEILSETLGRMLAQLETLDPDRKAVIMGNLQSLSKLNEIRKYTYTVDQVSGEDYNVTEVVDIFNRVNSKGTRLTRSDLALAHICSLWPEARAELRTFSGTMSEHRFKVDLSFLVRCIAAVATGSVILDGSFLKTPATTLQRAWQKVQPAFKHLVSVLRQKALISSLDDLPTDYLLIPATVYLANRNGEFPTKTVLRRFIRWIFLAGLWTRYSGSSESKLQQDVAFVSGGDLDPTGDLVSTILQERGRLTLQPGDLVNARINSAVARLSLVVARHREARDWFTGGSLYDQFEKTSLGETTHHIFSKQVLKHVGFSDSKRINELANRAFLVQPAPRRIQQISPSEYLPSVNSNHPDALQAQSIPMNSALWQSGQFLNFLASRRLLLAEAINQFIDQWISEDDPSTINRADIKQLIASGEGETIEFKSSLRWDRLLEKVSKELEVTIVKTVAGFLNAHGGTLLIGVADDGTIAGLDADFETLKKKPSRDGFQLHLGQLLINVFGEAVASSFITVSFHEINDQEICQITVNPSDHPIYIEVKKEAIFYLRLSGATHPLPVKQAVDFIQKRFRKDW